MLRTLKVKLNKICQDDCDYVKKALNRSNELFYHTLAKLLLNYHIVKVIWCRCKRAQRALFKYKYQRPNTDVDLWRARTTTTPSTGARPPTSSRRSPSPQRSSCQCSVSSLSPLYMFMYFVTFLVKTDDEYCKKNAILCPFFFCKRRDISRNNFS